MPLLYPVSFLVMESQFYLFKPPLPHLLHPSFPLIFYSLFSDEVFDLCSEVIILIFPSRLAGTLVIQILWLLFETLSGFLILYLVLYELGCKRMLS